MISMSRVSTYVIFYDSTRRARQWPIIWNCKCTAIIGMIPLTPSGKGMHACQDANMLRKAYARAKRPATSLHQLPMIGGHSLDSASCVGLCTLTSPQPQVRSKTLLRLKPITLQELAHSHTSKFAQRRS